MNMISAGLQHAQSDGFRIQRLVKQVFQNYTGSLNVRLWDGSLISLGHDKPVVTIIINTTKLIRELAWRPDPLRLAEAYFFGEIDVEGDLYALLKQRAHLKSLALSVRNRLSLLYVSMRLGNHLKNIADDNLPIRWPKPLKTLIPRTHSKEFNREAIAFHYDVSNDFYRLWLDEQMVYSCAYFNDPDVSIDQAQRDKLNHICRKLRLKTGERFLDIGCGWGALICWAAQHYGVRAHGITLSQQQYEWSKNKINDLGLAKQVTIELMDYRDLSENAVYEKVSSIGMFEHVGIKNLPTYFRAIGRVLKPGGLFLNHGITNDEEGGRKTIGSEFMQRYVFPDGELESVSNVQRVMEHTGFEIWDVEALRPHYVLTLQRWVKRLEAQEEEGKALVGEAMYRVWRLYMAACASQFEQGSIGVYQILATKRRNGLVDLPLTRRDLYL
jgi:cyclopropane-fatty-acyl-phospholipid synthase